MYVFGFDKLMIKRVPPVRFETRKAFEKKQG